MEKVYNFFGGRKLLWCFVVFAVQAALFGLGILSEGAWMESIKYLSILFIGGNVVVKAVHAFSRNPEQPPSA